MSKRAPYLPRRYRCECGRRARYRLRVKALRSDLCSELWLTLYLCETCLKIEKEMRLTYGLPPPKAVPLR